MLLSFFIETECKLSSIRNQTPEHPSNFDTHQNTFCGTEENISLASSEYANIPIPYLLLLKRIEKKLYWVRKGSTKMGIVTLIWYSQINICSKSSHDRTAYESGNARIATVWQRVSVWHRSPSSWASLTPPPLHQGASLPCRPGWADIREFHELKGLCHGHFLHSHLPSPRQAVSIRKTLQKRCCCTGRDCLHRVSIRTKINIVLLIAADMQLAKTFQVICITNSRLRPYFVS